MGTWSAKLICARVAVDPVFSVGVAADSGSLMDTPSTASMAFTSDATSATFAWSVILPLRAENSTWPDAPVSPKRSREQVLPLLRVRARDREGVVVLVPEHRGAAAEADEGQDPQPHDQPTVASDESCRGGTRRSTRRSLPMGAPPTRHRLSLTRADGLAMMAHGPGRNCSPADAHPTCCLNGQSSPWEDAAPSTRRPHERERSDHDRVPRGDRRAGRFARRGRRVDVARGVRRRREGVRRDPRRRGGVGRLAAEQVGLPRARRAEGRPAGVQQRRARARGRAGALRRVPRS